MGPRIADQRPRWARAAPCTPALLPAWLAPPGSATVACQEQPATWPLEPRRRADAFARPRANICGPGASAGAVRQLVSCAHRYPMADTRSPARCGVGLGGTPAKWCADHPHPD